MADIFISYSKADRDKVVPLTAYLESEGWTVWWDKHLAAGDTYRDEIMTQLATARAVVVLWTQNSIKSDFVRAEAGHAKARDKLIPVKESDVSYADIPLPFGEMHTEDLLNLELIRAAIIAQLVKPETQPSGWWISTRIFRSELLTWMAIICGAITIFSALQTIIHLSSAARWLVINWQAWTTGFWQLAFGWIGVEVPTVIIPVLSFVMFTLTMAVGVRMKLGPPVLQWRKPPQGEVCGSAAAYGLILLLCSGVMYFYFWEVARVSMLLPFMLIIGVNIFNLFLERPTDDHQDIVFFGLLILFAFVLVGPRLLFIDVVHMRERTAETRIAKDFMFMFNPLVLVLLVIPFVMTAIAPVRGLVKRLTFLAIGVAILAGLNQVALYAPSIRTLLNLT